MYKGACSFCGRIGKLSEKLTRSRRCMGGTVFLKRSLRSAPLGIFLGRLKYGDDT